MSDPLDIPAIRKALAECAAPPYMVNSRGPGMDGPPYELWHGQGLGGPVAEFQDYDEAECFAYVVNSAEALLRIAEAAREYREAEAAETRDARKPGIVARLERTDAAAAALDAALGGGA